VGEGQGEGCFPQRAKQIRTHPKLPSLGKEQTKNSLVREKYRQIDCRGLKALAMTLMSRHCEPSEAIQKKQTLS